MRVHVHRARQAAFALGAVLLLTGTGCQSFLNSWLDPTQVGSFSHEATLEIRSSLSIQDTPPGIPGATDPAPEDLIPDARAYVFGPGDQANIRVFELLQGNTETVLQVSIDEEGMISYPVLGRVRVAGLSAREMEAEIADILRQRDILVEAQVIVQPVVKRSQAYTIFGTVANPGVYAVARPDFRVQEAISIAGGLFDAVTEVYVFRQGQTTDASFARNRRAIGREVAAARAVGALREFHIDDGLLDGPPAGATATEEPASTQPSGASPLDAVLTDDNDEEELIRAVTGMPATSPAASAPEPESAPELLAEPQQTQPRFIFMNNEWIEVAPVTTQPQPVPVEPLPTDDEQLALPAPPSEPVTKPALDWSEIAGEETEQRIIRVSPEQLRNGDQRQNIVIRSGDSIRLVAGETGEYYVMGQVYRAGAYNLTGRRVTLKAAIAAAGNIAPLGWPDRCTIYRRYGDREEMKQVNLDAIFAGREADLFLKKDDVILVGTHPAAPFLAVIRNAFRMTYGFGFVYDRNFADIDSYGGKPNPAYTQPRFPNLFQ